MSLFSQKQHKRLAILHILATAQTLFKAFEKLSHEKWLVGGAIALCGLVMLLFTIFHQRIEEKRPLALPLFFLFEAIVIGIAAYLSYGKGYFYVYVFSSALYLIAGVRIYLVIKKKLKASGH